MREAIETGTGRINPTAVSDWRRIGKALVVVAVEQFMPATAKRQSDAITGLGMLVETGDKHHIAAGATVGDPAMHNDDAVIVVDPADAHAIGTQRRPVPAQPDQVLHEV